MHHNILYTKQILGAKGNSKGNNVLNIKTDAQQRAHDRRFWRGFWITVVLMTAFVAWMEHLDTVKAEEWRALAVPVIKASNSWRDSHCTVVEKSFGVSVQNGRYHGQDNMTTYRCTDGMTYNVAESLEVQAIKCMRDEDAHTTCQNLRAAAPFPDK